MNGSAENRASEASEQSGGRESVLTWVAANRMLPLVQRIAADLVACQARLAQLQPKKDSLDRQRHTLAWPQRARRYQLQEQITGGEEEMRLVLGELDNLGLTLVDPGTGQIGFPTLVNRRRAFFSWLPGDDKLVFWHYLDDFERRPIPAS